MLLHSLPRSEEFAQKFVEANECWNLEQLYQDIAFAKQQERQLYRKQLTPTEKACLRGLICGYSPTEIACSLNREPNGLRVELSRGLYRYIESLIGARIKNWSSVSKELENKGYKLHTIRTDVAAHGRDVTCLVSTIQNPISPIENYTDWGEAIDVSIFYGRQSELTTLQNWINQDKCRLVALLGMGGIGKTALSVKLAQLLENEFDFVIWRSLRDAPPVEELLDTFIKFFSSQQETNLPQTVGAKISRLIEYLRKARCLIVLDNFDAVLCSGQRAGNYCDGYSYYGELLQRLSETSHQSCLVLTSREKPAEVAAYSGEFLPVRTLQLSGLNNDDAQGILAAKGLTGSVEEIEKLIECYGGNPLALKIAATSIFDLFDGNIADFLHEETTVFNGVRNLLNRQFERLSPLEEDVMYWTCINREPVPVAELQADIVPAVSKGNILESLESLTWRSLIEKRRDVINHVSTFTQQPVIMEYMTDRLIAGATEEIKTGKINFLNKYALIKPNAKDYIRESQIRVIISPILDNLQLDLKSQSKIEQTIKKKLDNFEDEVSNQPGYKKGNLINLLHQLNVVVPTLK